MRFDILTIFPDLLSSPLQEGIIRRAVAAGKVEIVIHNIRDFAEDRHATTDDRPFGGGEGMVMKPEPLAAAVRKARELSPASRVLLLTPQGRTYNQEMAEELAGSPGLILVCGRYEGVDERFCEKYVDLEVSIGDYVLTGGELGALVLVDSITRLIPGVLGCGESAANDTFSRGGLKYPQYTRPRVFEGEEVPEVLLSGDHEAVDEWRFVEAVKRTLSRRPDLIRKMRFSPSRWRLLERHGLAAACERLGAARP